MFKDLTDVRIFVKSGRTDLRKNINGLSSLVQEEMELNPLTGNLFLFCNYKRTLLKILYWDKNGFCLWMKRLEKHRFPWPRTQEETREIQLEHLRLLLGGIDFWNAHEELHYSSAV